MTQTQGPLMFDYIILTVGTNYQLPPLGRTWQLSFQALEFALCACATCCIVAGCPFLSESPTRSACLIYICLASCNICVLLPVACRCRVAVAVPVAAAVEVVVVISCCSCQLSTAVCRWLLCSSGSGSFSRCHSLMYIFRATFQASQSKHLNALTVQSSASEREREGATSIKS